MLRADLIANASEQILSAALLGTGWEEALTSLAVAGGARGVTVIRNRDCRLVAALANADIAEPVATYLAGRAPPNSRQVRVSHNFEEGFRIDQDDYTEEETSKDPFYQEYLRPVGLFWHANARLNFEDDEELAISFKREFRRGPFGREDAAVLNSILPIARVVSRVASRVHDAQVSGVAQWLHRGGDPVFEIDFFGRVLRSHGFEDRDGCPMRIRRGHLTAANFRLQAEVNRAAMTAIKDPQRPAAIRLPPLEGARHILQFIPIKGRTRDVFRSARAIAVLLSRPLKPRLDVSKSLISDVFRLTDRELSIAMLVSHGLTLQDIAKKLHIRLDTVRFHLKRVFEKTGAHRQSELVILFASLQV